MLTAKQREAFKFCNEEGSFLLSVGVIRSGKTYSSAMAFMLYTLKQRKPYTHLIVGRKHRQLYLEVLPTLKRAASGMGLTLSYDRSEQIGTCGQQTYVFVAGEDERSIGRVQGITAHSIFADEVTLLFPKFFDTCLSRMSYADSKAWCCCNPDSPMQHIKKNHIDKGTVDKILSFDFFDNPTMTHKTVLRYSKQFSGVFAKRMIKGLWAKADGTIFNPSRVEELNMNNYKIVSINIGIDYGVASTTAFVPLLTLREKRGAGIQGKLQYYIPMVYGVTCDEDAGIVPDDNMLLSELAWFVRTMEESCKKKVNSLLLDPSAVSFRRAIQKSKAKKEGPCIFTPVRGADNDVTNGIRVTDAALVSGEVVIDPTTCSPLLDEMDGYVWGDNERPVKENDHYCDAMRYVIYKILTKSHKVVSKPQEL